MFGAVLLATSMLSSCGTMSNANVYIWFVVPDANCSPISSQQCNPGVPIQFQAGAFNYSFACASHTFQWNFGDGATASGPNAVHTFVAGGTYAVTLTISNYERTVTIAQAVAVYPGEYWPTFVHFVPHVQGNMVRFTTGVLPLNVPMERWVFDFGDGSQTIVQISTPPEVVHFYQSAGTYYVTLTAADHNATYSAAKTVTVPQPVRSRAVRH